MVCVSRAQGLRFASSTGLSAPARRVEIIHYFWMVLDENGYAHFIYTGDGVHYATNQSGSWITEAVDTSIVNDCDITLDANGEPYIMTEKPHRSYP